MVKKLVDFDKDVWINITILAAKNQQSLKSLINSILWERVKNVKVEE
jgi:hypothetical protein